LKTPLSGFTCCPLRPSLRFLPRSYLFSRMHERCPRECYVIVPSTPPYIVFPPISLSRGRFTFSLTVSFSPREFPPIVFASVLVGGAPPNRFVFVRPRSGFSLYMTEFQRDHGALILALFSCFLLHIPSLRSAFPFSGRQLLSPVDLPFMASDCCFCHLLSVDSLHSSQVSIFRTVTSHWFIFLPTLPFVPVVLPFSGFFTLLPPLSPEVFANFSQMYAKVLFPNCLVAPRFRLFVELVPLLEKNFFSAHL